MDSASLGHFTLVEKIGEGGMGRVYKARDTRLDRLVAIKLLPEARLAGTDRRSRFVQEARAASALNHPNIVTIHDIASNRMHSSSSWSPWQKPLNELIPRKGMRLTEGCIAAQVAGAHHGARGRHCAPRSQARNIMGDTTAASKCWISAWLPVADGLRAVPPTNPPAP
jgi:hypothetical protein